MSQHVAHRRSDEIHELRAEIERQATLVKDLVGRLITAENEIARLQALVEDALQGLHNDFEPDNQSPRYKRIKAALERSTPEKK